MSCGSKNEDRKQRERKKRRFNGSLELRTVRGRERESEREKQQKSSIQNSNSIQSICSTCVCVQCTLIYKSFGGLTEVLSYFNALKEHLLQIPKYIPHGISSSASPIGPNRLGTRYSASPIGPYRLGTRLLQPTVLGFFSRLGRC